jgi:transposase
MAPPISQSKRLKIAAAGVAGEGASAIAARFGVGKSTVKRLLRLAQRGESLEPRRSRTGPPPSLGENERSIVERLCAEDPHAT